MHTCRKLSMSPELKSFQIWSLSSSSSFLSSIVYVEPEASSPKLNLQGTLSTSWCSGLRKWNDTRLRLAEHKIHIANILTRQPSSRKVPWWWALRQWQENVPGVAIIFIIMSSSLITTTRRDTFCLTRCWLQGQSKTGKMYNCSISAQWEQEGCWRNQ